MITLKFEKKSPYSYLSHIDLLRHMVRIFRRTDLDVEFSKGFNPHMLLNFSVPLPLGLTGDAEYVTITVDSTAEEVLREYNRVCPKGLIGLKAWKTDQNPNLAGKVRYSSYTIAQKGADKFKEELENIPSSESYVIDYPTRKNPDGTKDISKIYSLKVNSDSIVIVVPVGDNNIRPDIALTSLSKKFGFEVSQCNRIGQFTLDKEGNLINADDYLTSLN